MAAAKYWAQTPRGFRRAASAPLSDRGFRYGMAVFETMRTEPGRVFFLDEHLASLREACLAASFPAPEVAKLRAFLPRIASGTGVARVHVTAGDGAPGDAVSVSRVFVGFEARTESRRPLHLQSSDQPYLPFLGGRKTHNYWRNAAAGEDALLFDGQGRLISAAMANVFVVNADDALLTPPTALGARAGIIRAWVCGRRTVAETTLDRETLRHAKEVFLTNSWVGIRSARSLDGRELPSHAVADALLHELQAHYDRSE